MPRPLRQRSLHATVQRASVPRSMRQRSIHPLGGRVHAATERQSTGLAVRPGPSVNCSQLNRGGREFAATLDNPLIAEGCGTYLRLLWLSYAGGVRGPSRRYATNEAAKLGVQ